VRRVKKRVISTRWWHRFGPATLKTRLALACTCTLLAVMVLLGGVLLRHAAAEAEQALLLHESAEAHWMSVSVGQRVARLQNALRAAAEPLDAAVLTDRAQLEARLQSQDVLAALFADITLVDRQGMAVAVREAADVSLPDTDLSERSDVRAALQRTAPGIEVLAAQASVPAPALSFAQPLLDGRRAVIGMWLATLRLDSADLLVHNTAAAFPGGLQTYLLDGQGRLLATPDGRHLLQPLTSLPPAGMDWVAAWPLARWPQPVLAHAQTLGSHRVARAAVPGTDWQLLLVSSSAPLAQGFQIAMERTVFHGMLMALVASALLLALVARLMRPLELLEARTRAVVAPGEPIDPEQGWPDARGEVGALEQAWRRALRESREAQAAAHSSLQRLSTVMALAPVGLALTHQQRIVLGSDELHRLLGYPPRGLVNLPAASVIATQEVFVDMQQALPATIRAGRRYQTDVQMRRQDGSVFLAEVQARLVNGTDFHDGTVWLIRDVTTERELHRQLSWSAHHDSLTGLANRRRFRHELDQLLQRLPSGRTGAALFLDLDRLKQINDSVGHAGGDTVLREVARTLHDAVGPHEVAARLGGDEFALLLPDCDPARALQVAESLRAAINALEVCWQVHCLTVGVSIGAVLIPAGTQDAEAVLHAADMACYEAKRAGRNAVRMGALPPPDMPASDWVA
jgi:diguanylate cyclase